MTAPIKNPDEDEVTNPSETDKPAEATVEPVVESPVDSVDDSVVEPEADTFPREYVEDLRRESAGYRTQLRTVQEQLHRALVEKNGGLADPADLEFDPAHLDDPEALQAAIAAVVEAKPHLKARKFVGDVGQGSRTSAPAEVNLLGMLQGRV